MVDILDEIDFDTRCHGGLQMDLRWIESNVESLHRFLNESSIDDSFDGYADDESNRLFALRRSSSIADSVSICGSSSADSLFDDLEFEPCSPTCSVVTEDMLPIGDIRLYQNDILSDLRDMETEIINEFGHEDSNHNSDQFFIQNHFGDVSSLLPTVNEEQSHDTVWSDCDTTSDYSTSSSSSLCTSDDYSNFSPDVPPSTIPTYERPVELLPPKSEMVPTCTATTIPTMDINKPVIKKIVLIQNGAVVLLPRIYKPQPPVYTLAECARRGIKVQLPKCSRLKSTRNQPYRPRPIPKRRSSSSTASLKPNYKIPVNRDLDSVLTATLSGKPSSNGNLDLKIRDLKLLLPSFQNLKNPDDTPENSNTTFSKLEVEYHPCTECGKSHNTLTELRNCLRDHRYENNRFEVVRRRTCPTCNKVCSSPVALRVHQMVHTGEKPYACLEADCNRTFREKSALKKHYKRFHPEKINNVAHHFVKQKKK